MIFFNSLLINKNNYSATLGNKNLLILKITYIDSTKLNLLIVINKASLLYKNKIQMILMFFQCSA